MTDYCLLTGATGLLGRYLLRDLLLEGGQVAVLIRSRDGQAPAERLKEVLSHWDRALGRKLPRRIHCLEGDVTLPGLGLSDDDRRWVARHCPRILHNAASLTFVGKDRADDPWLSNLVGTERVLDLCQAAGIRELHYISTAYVCGTRAGPVREDDLECGQEFRNDYEECKFEAEKRVRGADFLDRTTVYRPAIITGDSRTGYTTTYHGLYSYLYFPSLAVRFIDPDLDGRVLLPLRLNLTGDEARNLVPVDWVSAAVTRLLLNSAQHGRTYHLTPSLATTARTIEAAMSAFYNFYGPQFAGPDVFEDGVMNEWETGFYEQVSRYQPYWAREPLFDRRNLEAAAPDLLCPPLDLDCLRRLLEFAVRDNWGKRPRVRKSALAS